MSSPQQRSWNHGHDADWFTICSATDSNETTDALPGTGRTLGKVYSFAGRILERQLGSLTERLGRGPRMTAVKIQKYRLITASEGIGEVLGCSRDHSNNEECQFCRRRRHPDFSRPPRSRAESKKVEKKCKRLLRYIRSNVESTKKQALDHIIALSFEDEYVRELLRMMGAVNTIEPLQRNPGLWMNYGASLQISSRKALVTLTDTEVHMCARRIQDNRFFLLKYSEINDLLSYLHHPNYSFLVVRHLVQLLTGPSKYYLRWKVMQPLAYLIKTGPDDVEFEECDRILELWVNDTFSGNAGKNNGNIFVVLEIILRYADKLPRTIDSNDFQGWASVISSESRRKVHEIFRAYHIMLHFLRGIEAANSSKHGDLRTIYPHPRLRHILDLLISLPDLALCRFLDSSSDRIDLDSFSELEVEKVPDMEELRSLCQKIAEYARSEDSFVRERAKSCARKLLRLNICYRTAMLKALQSTRMSDSDTPFDLIDENEQLLVPKSTFSKPYNIYRHCDVDGNLLHLSLALGCIQSHCAIESKMTLYNGVLLKLRLKPGMAASSTTGHYPILAGHTVNGERAYVAEAHFSDGFQPGYCFVTDVTKPKDLSIQTRKEWSNDPFERRTPTSVYVIALRWAPDAYAGDITIGLDATGPFSWKPLKYHRLPRTGGYNSSGSGELAEENSGSSRGESGTDKEGLGDSYAKPELKITLAEEASTDEEEDLSKEDGGSCKEESGTDMDDEDWRTAEEGSVNSLDATDNGNRQWRLNYTTTAFPMSSLRFI